MKVLMTMAIEIHGNLLKACEPISPKYQVLKNGLIETDADGRKVVKVLCETDQATEFLAWANEQRPGSAALIIISQDLTK